MGRQWRNFGCAGPESRTVGGDADEKGFTLTRTGIGGTIAAVLERRSRSESILPTFF